MEAMSTASTRSAPLPLRRTSPDVRLTSWPLRDDTRSTGLAAVAMLAIAGLSGWLAGSLVMGLLCAAALGLASWRLWIPITYELHGQGIDQAVLGRRRRIAWPSVARYQVLRDGVRLLADPDQAPLASWRGPFIGWGGQRGSLLEVLDHYVIVPLGPHESTVARHVEDLGPLP